MTDSKRDCFDRDGFTFIRSLFAPGLVEQLRAAVSRVVGPKEQAGVRGLLRRSAEIAAIAQSNELISALTALIDAVPFAVRAILFHKTVQANWNVTWHQDLTIAVRERAEVPGFGPWSVKAGIIHTQAPARVLERMLTARIHLDDADEENGALRVIPASHRLGKLSEAAVTEAVHETQAITCVARSGDVLVMRPLLLHSSARAMSPRHRRVIHIEYAVEDLPAPLYWFERE